MTMAWALERKYTNFNVFSEENVLLEKIEFYFKGLV